MLAGTTNLRRLDQVEHFWDTVDTIGEGFGFSLFGARHLVTLALYIGFAALSCKLYKEMSKTGRRSSPQTGKWESKKLRASQGRKNHSAVTPAPEKGMEKAD